MSKIALALPSEKRGVNGNQSIKIVLAGQMMLDGKIVILLPHHVVLCSYTKNIGMIGLSPYQLGF
jgi:hypothetical protein